MLNKVNINSIYSCWEWQGSIDKAGYGRVAVNKKNKLAHRMSYQLSYNILPKELDHLCRNRKCINPLHLENVTRSENIKRGIPGQLQSHCNKGHPFTLKNTYILKLSNRTHRTCRTCRLINQRNRLNIPKEKWEKNLENFSSTPSS
jgi:hypothetical protein